MILTALTLVQVRADDTSRKYFTDTVVLDQQGQPRRFYSDLMEGKTAVIHSFFANCHGVCPSILGHMKALQEQLGDRLGKEVVLLSITVDPGADSPGTLRTMAESLGAKPGWFFLSGDKADIDLLLRKLGQQAQAKEDHSTVILIGNELSGDWTKVPASAKTEEIIRALGKISPEQSK